MFAPKILFAILGGLAGVSVLALIKHYSLYRYPRIPSDYSLQSDDLVVCSRPFDYQFYEHFYPLFKHTYFKTSEGKYGLQFCDVKNENCPDILGSRLMGDKPIHEKARDERNTQCWIISKDPKVKACAIRKMQEMISWSRYNVFPNHYVAIVTNVCGRFTDDVLDECRCLL